MTAASSDVVDDAGCRPIRVGISACLMGDEVRFDGRHKRDAFLTETFGRFVDRDRAYGRKGKRRTGSSPQRLEDALTAQAVS